MARQLLGVTTHQSPCPFSSPQNLIISLFYPLWKTQGMELAQIRVGTGRCLDPGHPTMMQGLWTGTGNTDKMGS